MNPTSARAVTYCSFSSPTMSSKSKSKGPSAETIRAQMEEQEVIAEEWSPSELWVRLAPPLSLRLCPAPGLSSSSFFE